jgi:hypothetical protein
MQSATRMEAGNTYLENCRTAHPKLCVDSWYLEGNGRTWLQTAAGRSRWPSRNQQTCGQAEELVHQRTIRTILASNPCVQSLRPERTSTWWTGGGRNNVMRQLRRHAIGED